MHGMISLKWRIFQLHQTAAANMANQESMQFLPSQFIFFRFCSPRIVVFSMPRDTASKRWKVTLGSVTFLTFV